MAKYTIIDKTDEHNKQYRARFDDIFEYCQFCNDYYQIKDFMVMKDNEIIADFSQNDNPKLNKRFTVLLDGKTYHKYTLLELLEVVPYVRFIKTNVKDIEIKLDKETVWEFLHTPVDMEKAKQINFD